MKKLAGVGILLLSLPLFGQFGGYGSRPSLINNGPSGGGRACLVPGAGDFDVAAPTNKENPGFVYARLRYHPVSNWRGRTPEVPWHHDYPDGDTMFPTSLERLTTVDTNKDAFRIVDIDSKDLFKYPFTYMSEPGLLELSDRDAKNLREYLDRGGFLLIDDFRGNASDYSEMDNLVAQLKKVYPDRELARLPATHPIFSVFYQIDDPAHMLPPYRMTNSGDVEFLGLSDDQGRLQIMVDFNNDTSEYWQALDVGTCSIHEAGTAVQLGVNYAIYAMTH